MVITESNQATQKAQSAMDSVKKSLRDLYRGKSLNSYTVCELPLNYSFYQPYKVQKDFSLISIFLWPELIH